MPNELSDDRENNVNEPHRNDRMDNQEGSPVSREQVASTREPTSISSASSSAQSLRRVFHTAFTVYDLAEPLISFDDSAPAKDVAAYMESNRFEVVGVRIGGHVEGYVELKDLGTGSCQDYLKPFSDGQVITHSASLGELVLQLRDHRRLFVSLLGRIGGIVSRSDLHKPPLRMWLFGMVTLIEMRFSRLIGQCCPNDSWQKFVSAGRLQKARELLAERIRRNQDLTLLECLQLSDKAQIVARSERLRKLTRFESRRQMEQATKRLEKLRNNLTHSQDIITEDWEAIVALSENLDNVLDGPPGLREPRE